MGIITDPSGPARGKIVIQTRTGRDIFNAQSFEISASEEGGFKYYRQKYSRAIFRSGVVPVYNCHGLTFGSRRSGIPDTSEVNHILHDDKYDNVQLADVLPGDIILYISAEDNDIEHSGMVISKPEEPFYVPWVLSKWGRGAEVIHWANHCPYDFSLAKYYRIRR